MKKINVTISISEETNKLLHTLISPKNLDTFISTTLNKALQDKLETLKKEYADAESDPDRKETIDEWKHLDSEDWQ